MKKRMKILHFMPDNYVWGGIESYLRYTLPLLKAKGTYDICAVVTQDSQLFHALKNAGLSVWGIPFPLRKKSFLRSLWINPWARCLDLSTYWHLLPMLKRIKPDLVHVHNGRLEQSLIKWTGFPMVYTYHGYGGPFNIEFVQNPLLQFLYKLARPLFRGLLPSLAGMTIVSQYEKDRLYREKFAPKTFPIQVIPNGLPIETILGNTDSSAACEFRSSLNLPENTRIVSFICRLRQDKNADAFLGIAKRVVKHPGLKNPVYFLVAGDGKYAPLFSQAFQADPILSQCGQYLGFRSDVPNIIQASDLTVSFSLQEGFGLRVLESLILGKPCITYAAGGIPEVMDLPEAQNWLVPLGNEDLFVETLVAAINLSQGELQSLSPILQAHAKRFDIAHHIQEMELFYQQVFTRLSSEHPTRNHINNSAHRCFYPTPKSVAG